MISLRQKISHSTSVLLALTKRHFLVFLKNWTVVLFTFLVPLVILLIYVLFLRPLEVNTIDSIINDTISLSQTSAEYTNLIRKTHALADSWIIAGMLAVSCITVSFSANCIMVKDQERGVTKDFLSSPISGRLTMVSYLIFNMLVTFFINLVILIICLIWLVAYGAFMISVKDFFGIIGILLLSVLSASALTFFICSFIHTDAVHSACMAIVAAAVGFLIGAYFPSSMMPKPIDTLTGFFPGTYSAGLLRNYFLEGPMQQTYDLFEDLVSQGLISQSSLDTIVNSLNESFTLDIYFFDYKVSEELMTLVIFIFTLLFFSLNAFFAYHNFLRTPKKNKKKKNVQQQ